MSERERRTIPILGINTAEQCHAVAEGSMEDIYNFRFKNSAFRNVCEPEILHPVTDDGGYTIVHKMERLADNEYIAIKQTSPTETKVAYVAILDGVITVKNIFASLDVSKLTFYSFGNVLYVNWGIGVDLQENSYIYKDERFSVIDLGGVEPPTFELQLSSKQAGATSLGYTDVEVLKVQNGQKEFFFNERVAELEADNYIVGLFAVMVAYVMYDGSVIRPSAPKYVSSYYAGYGDVQTSSSFCLRRCFEGDAPNVVTYYRDDIRGVKATVHLNDQIPVVSDLIKCARVFVTRVTPLWDYGNLHENFVVDHTRTGSFSGDYMYRSRIINKDALDLDRPFYELCDINKGDQTGSPITAMNLTENIVHKTPYKASFSNHCVFGGGKLEYNNRMHQYCIQTKLSSGYALNVKTIKNDQSESGGRPIGSDPFGEMGIAYLILVVKITIENKTVYVQRMSNVRANSTNVVIPALLAYPDVRAERFEIAVVNTQGQELYHKIISPKISYTNNMAYYFVDGENSYNNIHTDILLPVSLNTNIEWDLKDTNALVCESNKLQVSAMNNPFYFDPVNIYTIGDTGCSIQAINTAAEQITETKFGMFPLYVFTDKAITALEVGSGEILYSRLIDVSGERKLPNTGTVGAKNLVFFISARGVMAIEGRAVQCISEPLDKSAGLATLEFSKYCLAAGLSYNPIEEELICYNPSFLYAYVYSLQGKFWSRRDWSTHNIGVQTEGIAQGIGVVSAWIEDVQKPLVRCKIKSRAIKFGSLEFKRLETLVARLSVGSRSTYSLMVEGSNDLQAWMPLNSAQNRVLIRRTGASCKYFRISLTCNVQDYFAITNFDAEYYLRFARRLK